MMSVCGFINIPQENEKTKFQIVKIWRFLKISFREEKGFVFFVKSLYIDVCNVSKIQTCHIPPNLIPTVKCLLDLSVLLETS